MTRNNPHADEDRRRLIVAIVVSFILMIGYKHFIVEPREQALRTQVAQKAAGAPAAAQTEAAPAVGSDKDNKPAAIVPRDEALQQSGRITIDGKRLQGSLSLKGGRFDDLRLKDFYADEVSRDKLVLLSPSGTNQAYYVDAGWLSNDSALLLPTSATQWQKAPGSADTLTSGGKPVVLRWDNGADLVFERVLTLDDNFLFTIEQRVTNHTGAAIALNAYHTTARNSLPPDFRGFYAIHEGPVGYVGGHSVDPQYKSLASGVGYDLKDRQGWMGITDRFWLVAMLPDPQQVFDLSLKGKNFQKPGQHYQADIVDAGVTVAPGETKSEQSRLFVGAKDLPVIQDYQSRYGIDNFELSFDFGIYYVITKPFYYLLHFLIHLTNSVGFAMLAMTVIVRGALFPIASRSFRSMAKMRVVGPKLKEIQERYKDDREKLQREVAELYQREDVNLFSGCLPMFIQIPVFFALYKVIFISVELRQAPFWGWIHDLSQPDPTTIFNAFGLLSPWWDGMHAFGYTLPHIGAWPCLYCLTMLFQRHISPPMPDPAQERMQAWFPYIFSVMMAQFPVGLVIYYSWSGLLGVLQQYYIYNYVAKESGGAGTSLLRGHADRSRRRDEKAAQKAAQQSAGGRADEDPAG